MKIVVLLIPILLGAIGGGVLGFSQKNPNAQEAEDQTEGEGYEPVSATGAVGETEIIDVDRQFVIPVIQNSQISHMVILSLSLEVESGFAAAVYEKISVIRDRSLDVLLELARLGRFNYGIDLQETREVLKKSILMSLQESVEDSIRYVLVTDFVMREN